MRKTLAVMQVLTLCQCGGSLHCLPKYVSDGKRKRYHMALQSLELAVDKISIVTTALSEQGLAKDSVSVATPLSASVATPLSASVATPLSASVAMSLGPWCKFTPLSPTKPLSGQGHA